jgi:8-oxo-dGTP pyrophosphatase MutT (NUDIX family)
MEEHRRKEDGSERKTGVSIIFMRNRKILLQRRHEMGHCDGLLGLLGGRTEKGEKIKIAATREAKEEGGVERPGVCSCSRLCQ